ncbi:DUF6542 domain-containing protein [Nocardia heshunensis]
MAVTQRERTEVPPSHRSILPSVPGVPAGVAVLIAVTCTFIGFLIDANGGDDLTHTFATFYVIGCVLATLVVRYRGLFTTLVLPPLLLFLAVPVFYQLLMGSASLKVREILLNLAIPLVNRFPTMALATVLVLIIGAIRIALHRRESKSGSSAEPRKARARAGRAGTARAQRTRATDPKDPARRRFRAAADADPEADAAEPDATRASRRGATGRVAAGPPRVGANRPPAEGRRRRAQNPEQAAPAATEGRRRAQYGETPRTGERRAVPTDAPRTGERRAVPTDAPRTGERRAVPTDRTRTGERRAAPPEGGRRAAQPAPAPAPDQAPAEGRRRRAQSPEQAAARGTERHAAAPERNPAPGEGGRRRRAQPGEVPPHPRPNVRYRERDSGRIER